MKMAIKSYNIYHNFWDKLIFGLLIPIATIFLIVLIGTAFWQMSVIIMVIYTMLSELFRDFFSFNGAYSRHSHHTILRSSFYGKKFFMSSVMSEHIRNFLHYMIMLVIFFFIMNSMDHLDAGFVLISLMIVLVAYSMNTVAVNVLRYFDNYAMYTFVSIPFIAIAAMAANFIPDSGLNENIGIAGIVTILVFAFSMIVTVLGYIHASHCYDKSFEDKLQ